MMSASVRVESEEKEYKGNLVIDPLCGFFTQKTAAIFQFDT